MPSIASELTFFSEDISFARLCIEVTFYWRGSMFDQASRLTDAYRQALTVVRDGIIFYESGTMSGAKKLNTDTLEMVPYWLEKAKRREDIYLMHLKGGSSPDELSEVGIQFIADEEDEPYAGALSLSLPIDYAEKPESLVGIMKEIAKCADFDSGHCGFSLAWDPRGDGATNAQLRMKAISGRFLGIDLPKLNTTVSAMRRSETPRIKTVQWLTFIGGSITEQLGGGKSIGKMLHSPCIAHEAGSGVVIQAGLTPLIGDVNRKADISALHIVGQMLNAFRLKNHGPIFGTREQTGEWLARFER